MYAIIRVRMYAVTIAQPFGVGKVEGKFGKPSLGHAAQPNPQPAGRRHEPGSKSEPRRGRSKGCNPLAAAARTTTREQPCLEGRTDEVPLFELIDLISPRATPSQPPLALASCGERAPGP